MQVGLAPNPTIGYVAEEIGDDGTAGKQGAFAGQKFITGDKISGVQVGLPIPPWNKNQGGIQQAQSEIAAAERVMEPVELSIRQRPATAFQSDQDASFQITKYADEVHAMKSA